MLNQQTVTFFNHTFLATKKEEVIELSNLGLEAEELEVIKQKAAEYGLILVVQNWGSLSLPQFKSLEGLAKLFEAVSFYEET